MSLSWEKAWEKYKKRKKIKLGTPIDWGELEHIEEELEKLILKSGNALAPLRAVVNALKKALPKLLERGDESISCIEAITIIEKAILDIILWEEHIKAGIKELEEFEELLRKEWEKWEGKRNLKN